MVNPPVNRTGPADMHMSFSGTARQASRVEFDLLNHFSKSKESRRPLLDSRASARCRQLGDHPLDRDHHDCSFIYFR